jgi:hypothetical protein
MAEFEESRCDSLFFYGEVLIEEKQGWRVTPRGEGRR